MINRDRRNAAGGLACGERTVKKGGWLEFGGDIFYSPILKDFAGHRFYVRGISDAWSPDTAYGCIVGSENDNIDLQNVYLLACKKELPEHLEFLRPRLGKLTSF